MADTRSFRAQQWLLGTPWGKGRETLGEGCFGGAFCGSDLTSLLGRACASGREARSSVAAGACAPCRVASRLPGQGPGDSSRR